MRQRDRQRFPLTCAESIELGIRSKAFDNLQPNGLTKNKSPDRFRCAGMAQFTNDCRRHKDVTKKMREQFDTTE